MIKTAVLNEGVEVLKAIDEIGAEHAAEEHDFRHQEQPHAERGGILLLLRVDEMMQKRRIVGFVIQGGHLRGRMAGAHLAIVQREPPVPLASGCLRSCRLPTLRWEFPRN